MARRRTQWLDAILSTPQFIAGAVAPGTIVSNTILTETELENVGASTLIRIVGDLFCLSAAAEPVFTHTLLLFNNYVGGGLPTDWDNDTFERSDVLGTWMSQPDAAVSAIHHRIDLRTKRKFGRGVTLTLETQNHSPGGNDGRYVFHLRCLLLLA